MDRSIQKKQEKKKCDQGYFKYYVKEYLFKNIKNKDHFLRKLKI